MTPWLKRILAWWRKFFFWHSPPTSSQEFQPDPHHDHTLVLAATQQNTLPGWRQWRFFLRLLQPKERTLFAVSAGVFIISVLFGAGDLIRPRLYEVPGSGGTITEALVGSPKLINPLFAPLNDVDRDLAAMVYSGLFRLDADLAPQPDLAERFQWLEQGTVLEVVLRKDARFHDGKPVTADDVVFTFQAVKNPRWRSPLAGTFRGVVCVRVDDQTVQFQLDKPNPTLPVDLTLGILPAHIWEEASDSNPHLADANIAPVGSGPYQYGSFQRDSHGTILVYHLRRFPGYYGLKPYIENWKFRFYPDRAQAQQAIQSHQVDTLAFVPWGEAERLKSTNLKRVKIELAQETVAFFNTQDHILKDERIRKALALAVDRQELQDLVGFRATLAYSPFPFFDQATSTPPNLEEARRLLTTSGWILRENGSLRFFAPPAPRASARSTRNSQREEVAPAPTNASSTPLALSIHVPNQPDLVQVAQLLKRRWSLLGIQVSVYQDEAETLLKTTVDNRSYQILIWNILIPPDQDLSQFWESQTTEKNRNLSNLSDKTVDAAFKNLRSATSSQALLEERKRAERAILERTPALFLLKPAYVYLVSQNIQGLHDLRLARPMDRLVQSYDWYIDTEWRWR